MKHLINILSISIVLVISAFILSSCGDLFADEYDYEPDAARLSGYWVPRSSITEMERGDKKYDAVSLFYRLEDHRLRVYFTIRPQRLEYGDVYLESAEYYSLGDDNYDVIDAEFFRNGKSLGYVAIEKGALVFRDNKGNILDMWKKINKVHFPGDR